MILVVGATGILGEETARQLAAKGEGVRGLVRPGSDPGKVSGLEKAGVAVVRGDLREPQTLAAACRGVGAVVSTVSAMPLSWQPGNTMRDVDRPGQMSLIDAARKAGVRRLIYVSFPHDGSVSFLLGDAKLAAENHLRSSGMEFTILYANYFMEVWPNLAFGFDYGSCKATVFGEGHNRLSWVSFRDVARNAVEAISSACARNQALPAGGPQAVSPLEAIAIFEKRSGTSWQVTHVPVDALRKQKATAADEVQESVAALQIMYATSMITMDPKDYLVSDHLVRVEDYAESVVKKAAAVS